MIDYEAKVQELIDNYELYSVLKYKDQPGLVGPKFQAAAYELREQYTALAKMNDGNAPRFLRTLISLYLDNRDFAYALFCIGEYMSNKFPKHEIFGNFLYDLELIFQSMETELKKRKHKDIFLIMIDSMRHKDIRRMPFLDNLETYRFENAHSPSSYTRASVKGMFTGERLFDNGAWKDTSYIIDYKKSKVLQYLKDDYNIINLSGFRFFPKESGAKFPFIITKDDEGVLLSSWREEESIKYPASVIFWQYVCEVLKSDKPVFAMTLCEEFHTPCICAWHDKRPAMLLRTKHYTEKRFTEADLDGQIDETLKYIDNELKFFFSFGTPGYKIICGDHGQMLGEHGHLGAGMTWHDEASHVPLMVSGLDGGTDNLYSTLNMGDLIIDLIENDKVDVPDVEFIQFQRDHLYDRRFTDPKFSSKLGKKYICPFKSVIGKDDKTVAYRMGDNYFTEYYKNDIMQNVSENEERVKYMAKEISGTKTPVKVMETQ